MKTNRITSIPLPFQNLQKRNKIAKPIFIVKNKLYNAKYFRGDFFYKQTGLIYFVDEKDFK